MPRAIAHAESQRAHDVHVTTKAHFIIAAVGTAGDTLPLIALARHLVRRGHEVDFLAYDFFAPAVREADLAFHRVGKADLYHQLAQDATVWYWHTGFSSLWKYLAAAIPDTLAHVEKLRRSNTVMVASSGAVGLRLAQEKHRLPLATVHMSPFYFFSRYANVMGALGAWPRWMPMPVRTAALHLADRFFIDGACRDDMNAIRREMGLSQIAHVFTRWVHSPDKVICAVPDWFAPSQPDWPPHATSVAFPMGEKSERWAPDEKLAAFLANGPPPILFAAGTGAGAALTFFYRAVAVARLTQQRVILVTRWPEQIAQPLPDNVCLITHAPFDQLLPLVAGIVHNGGVGTIALAMQAGIPQVIVPFAYDQFYNGVRLAELGGGVMIRRERKPAALAGAIERVLRDPAIQQGCQENRQCMQRAGSGVEEMAIAVEALAGKSPKGD
jgi:rhamnosyltransferase subunit B